MLNIHLTLPIVVAMLRTIAQREPDRVGREENGAGCVYAGVKDGALYPICIVGQMFADLGLLRLLLNNPNRLDSDGFDTPAQYGACVPGYEFWNGLSEFGITADTDAQTFMRNVQGRQDDGTTWGEAFSETVGEWLAVENDRLDSEAQEVERKREALTSLFG